MYLSKTMKICVNNIDINVIQQSKKCIEFRAKMYLPAVVAMNKTRKWYRSVSMFNKVIPLRLCIKSMLIYKNWYIIVMKSYTFTSQWALRARRVKAQLDTMNRIWYTTVSMKNALSTNNDFSIYGYSWVRFIFNQNRLIECN